MATKAETESKEVGIQSENKKNEKRIENQTPIIIGALYFHRLSDKGYYILAASVVEGEEYVELTDVPISDLKKHNFRSVWNGTLEEFQAQWRYDKLVDEANRRYLKSRR